MKNMWVIRAGKDTHNFYLYKKENFVAVGDDIGDIKDLSYNEIKFRLRGKTEQVDFLAGVIRRFRDEVQIGDYFICTSPNSLYFLLGEIIGDVEYNPELSHRYQYTCYRRPVKWISKIYRNDLTDAAKRALSPQITVFKVKEQWQKEIFDNQLSLDLAPKEDFNRDIQLNKKENFSKANINLNKEEKEVTFLDNSDSIIEKYELKKQGLKLEKTDVDQAISFYKNLITHKLFFDDYYQFKRLTVCYHKKKDYQSEAEIIRYFLKSDIPCNKYQFYSFKYKLEKLVKRTSFTYSELGDLYNYFLENTFKVNYDEDLKNPPAERIIKKIDKIEEISEEEMIKRYKKGFLEAIADGLYHDRLNDEAYDLYVRMIYEYHYISFRYYQRLCSIYRRTKNYKHELMVIREYFEDSSIKKSKHNKKWFLERLDSTKELIDDQTIVDSILNSKYEKGAHLKQHFELKDLDYQIEENTDFNEPVYVDLTDEDISKYKLKSEALKLEDVDIDSAINTYKEFITNPLFSNDYWPYRRLVQLYDQKKDFKSQHDIIKFFFKSGIYCNNHQFLWFRNKLRRLIDKKIITDEEITDLENIFKNNGAKNKELSNTPAVIAERFRSSKGRIYIQPEEKYDKNEQTWEHEEIASEYKRQKKFDDAIKYYEKMIYELKYRSYRYYDELYRLYVKQNYLDKALNIIKEYIEGNSTHTKKSDDIFEGHIIEIKTLLSLSDKEFDEIILGDEKYVKNNENKESKPENQGNISLAKSLGVENEFSHILSINEEYEINLEKPINIYYYDDSLSESENINIKTYLIRSAKALDKLRLYDDLINIYKMYTKNNYFANDWYPYKQLCITYKKTNDYYAALDNIKELFLSGIWLNNYQYTWFTNKIRLLEKHIDVDEEQVQSWLDFYELNGAKNEERKNHPCVLADRIKLDDNKILVQSEEAFDLTQKIYYFEETGRILEKKGKYKMAINFYQKKIDYYPLFVFYQRICYCLEKLEDYESELDCIKEYYQNPPKDVSYESESWFKNRLKKVNDKLGTDYGVEDFI